MSKAFTSEETSDDHVVGRPVTRVPRGQERPMTVEGHRALLRERDELLEARSRRQGAKSEGDEARDHRLALITATLENVRVVVVAPPDGTVRFGSRVTLEWEDGSAQVVTLVGPDELGVAGHISIESPLARTLVEQREGDEVEVTRPRGAMMVLIKHVR